MKSERICFERGGVRLVGDLWKPTDDRAPRGSVLLLHGGGQTRHSWRASGRAFAHRGWETLAMDARGHGDSGWDLDGDYSVDSLVADLTEAASQLDSPPVLIGASMGGLISMIAQGENPDLSRAVVLVDVTPRLEPAGAQRITDFMSSAPNGFGSLREVSDAIHAYNPHRPRPASLEGLKKNVRLWPDGRWHWHWDPRFLASSEETMSAAHLDRLEHAGGAIKVPTMLVRGSRSDVVSQDGVEDLLRILPGTRVEEAAAGHMIAGDDNNAFAHHVVDFLEGVGVST